MGIECGGSGIGIFLWGERRGKLLKLRSPVRFAFVKSICQTAPAHILRQNFLFLGAGLSVVLLQLLEQTNGIQISAELCLRATLAKMVIGDVEILCGKRRVFGNLRLLHGNIRLHRNGNRLQCRNRKERIVALIQPRKGWQSLLTFYTGDGIGLGIICEVNIKESNGLDDIAGVVQIYCLPRLGLPAGFCCGFCFDYGAGFFGILGKILFHVIFPIVQLGKLFFCEIAPVFHQFSNALCKAGPGEQDVFTACLFEADALGIVILGGMLRSGERRGVPADAVFLLQKCGPVSPKRMGLKILIDSVSAAGHSAAMGGDSRIDFVCGDKG